jgi:hypothetical protein
MLPPVQVVSRSPLTVGSLLWMPRPGAHALTVLCKATFRLAPEHSPLAEVQEPVWLADEHLGGDPARGLSVPSDAVPWKRQPEVILVGHAVAPGDAPVSHLLARLSIGDVDKAIQVTGDRHFKLDGTLSAPARFSRMPLVWERAAGGPETANPAGIPMGSDARADGWGRVPVPNLGPPDRVLGELRDVLPPVGFGPIAPDWPARRMRLSSALSVGQPWDPRTLPHSPLPPELDRGYFNAAPADQFLRELRGDERLVLENLCPGVPRLTTRLAPIKPRADVEWGNGTYEVVLTCDTLFIDSERGFACLTYRGTVALDQPDRPGWVIVSLAGAAPAKGRTPRQTLLTTSEALGTASGGPAWLDRDAPGSARSARPVTKVPVFDGERDIAYEPTGELEDEATFTSEAGPVPPEGPRLGAFRLLSPLSEPGIREEPSAGVLEDAPTLEPLSDGDEPVTQKPAFLPGIPAAPLPGGPLPPPVRVADTERPPSQPEPEPLPLVRPVRQRNTLTSFTLMLPHALPFGKAPDEAPETVAPQALARTPLPFAQHRDSAPPPAPLPPAVVPPPPEALLARPFAPLFVVHGNEPPPSLAAESTQDVAPAPAPPPPLRMGPLATYEMALAEQGPSLAPAADAPAEAAAAAAPSPPPLPTEKYDLARCARLDAAIARTPAESPRLLEAEELTEASWPPLRDHWAREVRRDAERGKTAKLRAYDDAYVGQLEDDRGPIAVDEYARITVAVERGTASATLAELGLPDASLMRIQRVWMQKTSGDAELRRLARSAVERARED